MADTSASCADEVILGIAVTPAFAEQSVAPDYVAMMRDDWMPWVMEGIDLGDDVLALIVGPGTTVSSLTATGRRLTVGQGAPAFTAAVAAEFSADAGVDVVDVEPWHLPFTDARFTAVTAVMALHHVPSSELQDRTLGEFARVLRPGGVLVGLNALDGPHFRRLNAGGTSVPVEPLGFPERLRAAGFVDVAETIWTFVRFTGRAASGGER